MSASTNDLPICRFCDLGKEYQVDLKRASFVVQHFAQEIPWGPQKKASLIELLKIRAEKGFF